MGIITTQTPGSWITQYPNFVAVAMDSSGKHEFADQLLPSKSSSESTIPDGYETASLSGLGTMETGGELTPYLFDQMGQEFNKQSRYKAKRLAIGFTEEMIDWAQYGFIEKAFEELGATFNRTRNVEVAQLFDNAFNTTYFQAPDGEAIISKNHKSAAIPSLVRSNTTPTDVSLSYTGLKALITQMMGQKSARGYQEPAIGSNGSLQIAISHEAFLDLSEILHDITYYKPGTDLNDANVLHQYNWDIVWNPYFTNTSQFFLMNPDDKRIYFVDDKPFEIDRYTDPKNDNEIIKAKARWTIHVEDWKTIYGAGFIAP